MIRAGDDLRHPLKCKVGISSNPTARLASLQAAVPFPLSFAFIGVTDGTDGGAIEREAHRLLDRCRVEGEWFDCSTEAAISAVTGAAAKLDERLCPIDPSRVDEVRLAAASNAPGASGITIAKVAAWLVIGIGACALMIAAAIAGFVIAYVATHIKL